MILLWALGSGLWALGSGLWTGSRLRAAVTGPGRPEQFFS
jgi:hypothetical protein